MLTCLTNTRQQRQKQFFIFQSIKQFLHLRTTCKQWNQIIPIVFIDEIKSLYENNLECRVCNLSFFSILDFNFFLLKGNYFLGRVTIYWSSILSTIIV